MAYASFQAFRTAVEKLIEGDDIGDTFDVSTLDLIIGLAESRIYVGDADVGALRASSMLTDLSVAVSSNTATLPADLLELHEVYFAGEPPLEIVPLERIRRLEEAGYTGGTVRYAAQDGDTLRFWPSASGTLLGSYYARPTALETVSPFANATTFHRYPELFIFASLVEAMPFIGMEQRIPFWDGRYKNALLAAKHAERMRVNNGGRMRVRTS